MFRTIFFEQHFSKTIFCKIFYEKILFEIINFKKQIAKCFSKNMFSKKHVQSTTSHEIERNFQDIFLTPLAISHLRLRANFLSKTSKKDQNNFSFCILLLFFFSRQLSMKLNETFRTFF